MAVVRLPAILARETGGRASFETGAATLREALLELPVADLLFDAAGRLRPLVNVYVDGLDRRGELDAPLDAGATVRVVAAVAGGALRAAAVRATWQDARDEHGIEVPPSYQGDDSPAGIGAVALAYRRSISS